jgi:hypothetical protein
MASILNRLYRIARSAIPRPWEKNDPPPGDETDANAGAFAGGPGSGPKASGAGGVPPQVVDDLAVFGLVPPASMDDVRRARNREVKKFHSDRFLNDPERLETSKKIMQIYNAAYDRLKAHYRRQSS